MKNPTGQRLEQYTLRYPQEVLLVNLTIQGEPDQVLIFRGFSSSLMQPTAFDPEVPVISEIAQIQSIDRLQGPYNPDFPRYIEQSIPWTVMESRLEQVGL